MSTSRVLFAGALTVLGLLATSQAWAACPTCVPQEEVVQDEKNPKQASKKSTDRGNLPPPPPPDLNQPNFNQTFADSAKAMRLAPSRRKKSDQAIAACTEAIKLDPNSAAVWLARAEAYFADSLNLLDVGNSDEATTRLEQAIADCTEAIRLNPGDAAGWNLRGRALCKRSQLQQCSYDQAIADLTEAIRLNPKIASFWHARGEAYFADSLYLDVFTVSNEAKQRLEQASADCNKAIRLNPDSAASWSLLGQVHFHQKNYEQALADFVRSRELEPNQTEIESWLKETREQLKARGR